MGLLDILNGMQNGQGQNQSTNARTSGGMSPMNMALIGLLAYKAFKGFSGGQSTNRADAGAASVPAGSVDAENANVGGLGSILGNLFGNGASKDGGLNELIPGGLDALLKGAGAGGVLSGGLSKLINDFQSSGDGRAAQSWVGHGPNEDIAPESLEAAVGADTLDGLAKQTGLGRQELIDGLRQHLPNFVDQLTPGGHLPTAQEVSRMV
jgi:uncharacterized protein YidB (DUF937 family)